MFGNPSAERTAIEMTYEDTATIYRTAPQTALQKSLLPQYTKGSSVDYPAPAGTEAARPRRRTTWIMTPQSSLPRSCRYCLGTAYPCGGLAGIIRAASKSCISRWLAARRYMPRTKKSG